tara:strand:- start:497 stop:700 length:204 start_codon:yes stop_codon:yes gene_type:complete
MAKKLVGKQTKLDKNKDGKISGEDFKMMKKGGRVAKKTGGRVKKMGGGSMMQKPMAGRMYRRGGKAK